jgi:hypothetical protein
MNFAQSNVTHWQYEQAGSAKQSDNGETEPDLLPVRWCIEQP